MRTQKNIQADVDLLAGERKYWRELANGLGDKKGSPIIIGLTSRLKVKLAEDTETLKALDPTDPVAIAKAQTAIKTCEQILADFDIALCSRNIATLDRGIKKLQNELAEAKKKKKTAPVGGFGDLRKQ